MLIVVQPLVRFRPTRLTVDPGVCDGFAIQDVKVGRDSQFLTATPVQGIFASPGIDLYMDEAGPGIPIKILVENKNSVTMSFKGALIGIVEERTRRGAT
jgi:hypothetical protein